MRWRPLRTKSRSSKKAGRALVATALFILMANTAPATAPQTSTVDDSSAGGTGAVEDICSGVICTPLDACHQAGVCDNATGKCSDPVAPNGTSCDDGDPWTVGDVCTEGVCEAPDRYAPAGCLSEDEQELADLVNEYRGENGLPAVPLSTQVTQVAQWHVQDSAYAREVTGDYGSDSSCNLHTWYGIPSAPYTTCCYTSDHAQASCMWDKPFEVSGGTYESNGYENSASGYPTVAGALDGWKQSAGHNAVILNLGIWTSVEWRAMGVGVSDTTQQRDYYLWFSEELDPSGSPQVCPEPSSALLTAGALVSLAALRRRRIQGSGATSTPPHRTVGIPERIGTTSNGSRATCMRCSPTSPIAVGHSRLQLQSY